MEAKARCKAREVTRKNVLSTEIQIPALTCLVRQADWLVCSHSTRRMETGSWAQLFKEARLIEERDADAMRGPASLLTIYMMEEAVQNQLLACTQVHAHVYHHTRAPLHEGTCMPHTCT